MTAAHRLAFATKGQRRTRVPSMPLLRVLGMRPWAGCALAHVSQAVMAVQPAKHYGVSAQFQSPLALGDEDDFVLQ